MSSVLFFNADNSADKYNIACKKFKPLHLKSHQEMSELWPGQD